MPARLTVHVPFRPARSHLVRDGNEYTVGRDENCDVVLDDDRASRCHARLESAEGGWRLTDLGSKNGTVVDGEAIGSVLLVDGSLVSFGGLLGRFDLVESSEEAQRSRRQLERWQTSVLLQRELDPAQGLELLLERILSSVLRVSGAERAFVMLNRNGGDLEVAATSGLNVTDLESSEFSGSIGAVQRAIERRTAVAVADLEAWTTLRERPSVMAAGIKALVAVPLVAMDRLLGVIYADSRTSGASFEELDVEILEALGQHAALAVAVAGLDSDIQGILRWLSEQSEPDELRRELVDLRQRWLPEGEVPEAQHNESTWEHLVELHAHRVEAER